MVLNSNTDDQPLGMVVGIDRHTAQARVHEWSWYHEPAHDTGLCEAWPLDMDLVKMYVQAYTAPHTKTIGHDEQSISHATLHVVRGRMDECPTMAEHYGWGNAIKGKTISKYSVRFGRGLIQGSSNTPPPCQLKWDLRFPHIKFDWKAVWANIWHHLTPNKFSAHLWKALHMIGRDGFMCKPAECPHCKHANSRGLMLMGGTHATWQCPRTHKVWTWLSKQWFRVTSERVFLRDSLTLYTGLMDTSFPHQWRLLHQATHYFIWLAWCKWAHEQVIFTHHTITSQVIAYVGDHIAALHHNASAALDGGKAVKSFYQTWCDPKCKLCEVVNGKVVMYHKL